MIEGIGITGRKASGKAYMYAEEEISYSQNSDRDVTEEKKKFQEALNEAEQQLEDAKKDASESAGEDEAEIFQAQIQFLRDPQIESNVNEKIEEGLTAEASVEKGFEDPIQQLEGQEGRMAERADDLRDIRNRLLRVLTGEEKEGLSDVPENSIIVAENLKPSDTSELDIENVKGIVTSKGSSTSHVAILSKSMGLPAVVGAGNIDDVEDGQEILIDGKDGKIIINPSEEQLETVSEQEELEVIEEKVETKDGEPIEVASNVANPEEVEKAVENGADGIGLYRTEFMFLDREEPPTEEEHLENYVEALDSFPENRVVVRTMDIGGDKEVPYLELEDSDNPFLSVRGIRLAFGSGEDLFDTQMKALLRAAASENGENLSVMFPMISSVGEFEEVLEKVEYLEGVLEGESKNYDRPEIGLMVETPSAVQMASELAERADFLSIGTNDLTQYTMVASRIDSKVSDFQNPLYPAVLRSIKNAAEGSDENTWIGMCGEMAGDSELTELLIGLGLDELSMSGSLVSQVKNNVKEIESSEARETADRTLEASTLDEVEEVLDL